MKLNLTNPTSKAQAFAQKHQINAVPTIIFLSANGKEVLGRFTGYRDAEDYLKEMRDITEFLKLRDEYEKNPEDIEVNFKLAKAYLVRNRLKDAEPMIQRVLRADPENAQGYAVQIYTQRAMSQLAQGQFEAAQSDIEKVKAFDSEGKYLPELYFRWGYELGNRDKMEEAVGYFEKVLNEYPQSETADSARFFAGLVYFLLQQDDKALPLLQEYAQTGKDEQWRQHAQQRVEEIKKRSAP